MSNLTKEHGNGGAAVFVAPESHMVGCTDSAASMSLLAAIGGMTIVSPIPRTSSSVAAAAAALHSESNDMTVELVDLKSKLRKARQELEENVESQHELREELELRAKRDADALQRQFERENGSLKTKVAKLQESLEQKSMQLDVVIAELGAQANEAQRVDKALSDVEQKQRKLTELEKLNLEMTAQRDIDADTIAILRQDHVERAVAAIKMRHCLWKLGVSVDQSVGEDGTELNVKTIVRKLVRNPETFATIREIMEQQQQQQQQQQHDSPNATLDVLCQRKEISSTVEKDIDLSSPRSATSLAHLSEVNTQLTAANASLRSSNDQLQADMAGLSVVVLTLAARNAAVNTQLVALQFANLHLAAGKDVLRKQAETQRQEVKLSLQDQARLRCLHNQLSAEYELLNQHKGQLKVAVRDLRNETCEQRERITSLEKQIEELIRDNGTMKMCCDDLALLRTEHSKLADDFRNLSATCDRFKNEHKHMLDQYEMIRIENSKVKLHNTALSGEISAHGDQVKMLELKYEMLERVNADLDTNRQTLIGNLSQLLSQYHELSTRSLEDKQHFHNEEMKYAEHVRVLCRQKEQLLEEIIQHKKMSKSPVPQAQYVSVNNSSSLPPFAPLLSSLNDDNNSENCAKESGCISPAVSAPCVGDGDMLRCITPIPLDVVDNRTMICSNYYDDDDDTDDSN